MNLYDELVMQAQYSYSEHYGVYARGGTPYALSARPPLPYAEEIALLKEKIREADIVIVGGASGLSAAGGGDFYYGDTPSFRQYFGKFAAKYGFAGAFAGMQYRWPTDGERWAFVAAFLHATQTAPVRKPYRDLQKLLSGKDVRVITTNQDTQFIKLFPESRVAELQGDHRFFQCSRCCSDETWDAVKPVEELMAAQGDGTKVPEDMIPRCPHCGAEMFPWVRGYGNFLEGTKYGEEYGKASAFVEEAARKKALFLELGVGRMTPMFIQEPFWSLTLNLKDSFYIAVNDRYAFLPAQLDGRGCAIKGNIAAVLADAVC